MSIARRIFSIWFWLPSSLAGDKARPSPIPCRSFPERPSLEHLRQGAKDLAARAWRRRRSVARMNGVASDDVDETLLEILDSGSSVKSHLRFSDSRRTQLPDFVLTCSRTGCIDRPDLARVVHPGCAPPMESGGKPLEQDPGSKEADDELRPAFLGAPPPGRAWR